MRVILVKKTLLVSAIALAISGNAIAAEMYGNIRLGLRNQAELDVQSGKLVLGSKGSSDLGNGLTASYQLEMEHDQADIKTGGGQSGDGTSGWANDKSWVALGGSFGKVTAGRSGGLSGYACAATDILTMGGSEACDLGGFNTEIDDAIKYVYSGGAFELGYVFTADGTAADDDSIVGFSFSGGNWQVGGIVADDASAGTSPSTFGGYYKLGDMTFGVTLGDDDSATDSAGTDLAFQMPLAGGNLGIVLSTMDVDNTDSTDIVWTRSLGGGAYTGVEYNSDDVDADDQIDVWVGMNF